MNDPLLEAGSTEVHVASFIFTERLYLVLQSIVHGTDSEKRVTKLEAENVQLQKQLAQTIDQLRQQQQQQHTVIPGGEGLRGGGGVDEESTYPNVASTVQQYESRKYETNSKVNGGGVERLKERQNPIDAKASSSFSSSSSTSQAAAAKHHSHLSSAAESLQLQQPSSLSASDAVNMDMYKRNLLADIGRLPQSVSAEVKRWTSDEGPEVDQDRDLGSCTEGNQMSLKEQTKDNMEAEARGMQADISVHFRCWSSLPINHSFLCYVTSIVCLFL